MDTFSRYKKNVLDPAHIIAFGNEKGGSGKSTSAMHTAVGLLRSGYRIGTIDLDARQGTISRYMKNRYDYMARTGVTLPMPVHMAIEKSTASTLEKQRTEERSFLRLALGEMKLSCDFIVIDTPGTDNHLSRLGNALADTLVTPMNDSLLDFDLIATIDPATHAVKGPSIYTKTIQAFRQAKLARGHGRMEWVLLRNRLADTETANSRLVSRLLEETAEPYDFKIAPGLGENEVFRDMFLNGLTIMDVAADKKRLSAAQKAAHRDVLRLLEAVAPAKSKEAAKNPYADPEFSELASRPPQ